MSSKTEHVFLATCVRNVWLITSIFNIQLQVSHIPGNYNCIADLLSRWTIIQDPEKKLHIRYLCTRSPAGHLCHKKNSHGIQTCNSCMFRDFLRFLVAAGLCHLQVSHPILLIFIEFMAQNGFLQSNIDNHMAGIRSQFIVYGLNKTPL